MTRLNFRFFGLGSRMVAEVSSMQMILRKIKPRHHSLEDTIRSLANLNETLRKSPGFLSGILLKSRQEEGILFYMSMWLDEAHRVGGQGRLDHFLRENQMEFDLMEEDELQVLVSVTTEGDFRPPVS